MVRPNESPNVTPLENSFHPPPPPPKQTNNTLTSLEHAVAPALLWPWRYLSNYTGSHIAEDHNLGAALPLLLSADVASSLVQVMSVTSATKFTFSHNNSYWAHTLK
jgi:hypothetical protein